MTTQKQLESYLFDGFSLAAELVNLIIRQLSPGRTEFVSIFLKHIQEILFLYVCLTEHGKAIVNLPLNTTRY